MTTDIAFREGFAQALASAGVSPETVSQRLEGCDKSAGGVGDALSLMGKGLGKIGYGTLTLAALTPSVLAGAIGYAMAGDSRVSKEDIAATRDVLVAREIEEQRARLAEQRSLAAAGRVA